MTDDERRKAFDAEQAAQRQRIAKIRSSTLVAVSNNLKDALVQLRMILGNNPSEFQSFLLPQIEAQVLALMTSVGNQSAELVGQSLSDAWEAGIDMVDLPLQSAGVGVSMLLPAVDIRQLVNIQHFGVGKIKGVTAAIAEKISSQLGLTVLGAQSSFDSMTIISNLLEETDKERALRIVRTEIGRAYAVSTQQRLSQSRKYLPGMRKKWHKSGKLHPRSSHFAAHDQIVDVDDYFIVGGVRMLHPHDPLAPVGEVINCGCEHTAHMDDWKIETS